MIVIMNFSFAIGGGLNHLVFMSFLYQLLDFFTPFVPGEEFSIGKCLVGQLFSCIFIGFGIAIGLVIGLGLN